MVGGTIRGQWGGCAPEKELVSTERGRPRAQPHVVPLGTIVGFTEQNRHIMLRWVLTFLIVAIIAGIFGFTGIAEGAASIAKVIFFIFLALVVLSLIFGGSIWKKVD